MACHGKSATSRFDVKTAEGKKKIGNEIIPVFAKISDDLVRSHYIDKFAKFLDLDINLVAGAVEKKMVSEFANSELIINTTDRKHDLDVEKYFLALFFFQDEISKQALGFVKFSDFEDENAADTWKALNDIITHSKKTSIKEVVNKLPKKLESYVDKVFLVNISPVFSDRELWMGEVAKMAIRIRKASIKRKLEDISNSIKEAEKLKDTKKIETLTKRFDDMSKTLKEKVI